MKVRKAVIPAAGLGTRFFPASKSVPKELLPVLDKPLIQYAVEEAVCAGMEEVIIISSPDKPALEAYFQPDAGLEELASGEAARLTKELHQLVQRTKISFAMQEQPLGLGHAVLTAAPMVGDEPFLVLLPDDLIFNERSATQQLIDAFESFGGSVIAVAELPQEAIRQYGIIKATPVTDSVYRVEGLVEKPEPADAPSNLGIVGRYLLQPQIFPCLERTTPGAKGEIQLTDGMALLLEEQPVYACRLVGIRHDGGSPLGLLKASLEAALREASTRKDILEFLRAAPQIDNLPIK